MMLTAQLSKKHHSMRGYTLIEILIVLFIISIVTSVALVSISRNENKQMETLANELVQVISLAEEQAMLQPSVLGVKLDGQQLTFNQLLIGNDNKSNWVPLPASALTMHSLPDNIQVRIAGAAQQPENEEKKLPQIIISTNGDITPFTIYIGKKGQKPRFAVKGDADGKIVSTSLS